MQTLLIEILDWVYPKSFNLDNCPDNGSKECLLEVDLGYPEEEYNLHSDYPFKPEKIKS